MTDANGFEERTTALVVLLPAEDDPVDAASSEDITHMTFTWFGELSEDVDVDTLQQEVRQYAAETTPITVPVKEFGELGDEGAQVAFLEPTDSLLALRDGLLENEVVRFAHDAVEQYPTWTPHVTLGYPEAPQEAEYDGDEITFDRFAVWIGDQRWEYPMSKSLTAAATLPTDPDEEVDKEIIDDPDEPLVDDALAEVPVHGVMAISGKPTGDGRMFALGGETYGDLPAPLGYEFEGSHGGGNSRVAVVGRIDEMWTEQGADGVNEHRFRGVIMPGKEYGNQAIEGIVDGSYRGLSVIVDDLRVDVETEKAEMAARLKADRDAGLREDGDEELASTAPVAQTDADIDALVDEWMGDGKMPVTTFSEYRFRRFDQVPTGALMEAWIGLGHEFPAAATDDDEEEVEVDEEGKALVASCGCSAGVELEELEEHIVRGSELVAAPGTKDGPGWITNPSATARLRRYWVKGEGAVKIAWGTPGDFNRCRAQLSKYVQNPEWLAGLCANMHKEALGIWPAQHLAAEAVSTELAHQRLALVASPSSMLDAQLFKRPDELDEHGAGVIVDGDHVYGYVAEWGTCHLDFAGACVTPPFTSTDYAYFATGYVETTEGDIRVGQITMDTVHAGERMNSRAAAAHYADTGNVVADIAVGEDARGIWFSGAIRRNAPEAARHALKASGRLSGDWRDFGQPDLELVAALAVNTPGFPIPHTSLVASAGRQTALIAAGIVGEEQEPEAAIVAALGGVLTVDDVVAISRNAVAEYRHQEELAARVAATAEQRATLKMQRRNAALARIGLES